MPIMKAPDSSEAFSSIKGRGKMKVKNPCLPQHSNCTGAPSMGVRLLRGVRYLHGENPYGFPWVRRSDSNRRLAAYETALGPSPVTPPYTSTQLRVLSVFARTDRVGKEGNMGAYCPGAPCRTRTCDSRLNRPSLFLLS